MSFSISGRTAIVTGAANGVGLAIARHFVEKGAQVMFADNDETRLLAEVGPEMRKETGPIRFFTGDLRQKLAISNLMSATFDAFERVDILVNAAWTIRPSDPLSPEDDGVEALWQANAMTTLRLSQHVARLMIAQAEASEETTGDAGTIVNISSILSERTRPELMGFSLASSAVEQITRSLALALAPKRIRVNAISIGSMMTASLQAALKEHPELREPISACTPLGRIASSRELAETVQYLVSPASSFMTGHVLRVDGGRTLVEPMPGAFH